MLYNGNPTADAGMTRITAGDNERINTNHNTCLHARSVQRHTWVLMGPDSNKMLQPGFKSLYKYICWPCGMEII